MTKCENLLFIPDPEKKNKNEKFLSKKIIKNLGKRTFDITFH